MENKIDLEELKRRLRHPGPIPHYVRTDAADAIESLAQETAELRRELEEARKNADNWNWLANDCDGNAQDDFIQWLARNVADKEVINAKIRAARQQQGDDAKG